MTTSEDPKRRRPTKINIAICDLIEAGLITPPMRLEKTFRGVTFRASVLKDGTILFKGRRYHSVSLPAALARKSVVGQPEGYLYPPTNGWVFWKYSDEGKLKKLDRLRQKLR